MKFNKLSKTLSMTALTAAMAVAPAINVFAAPEDIQQKKLPLQFTNMI